MNNEIHEQAETSIRLHLNEKIEFKVMDFKNNVDLLSKIDVSLYLFMLEAIIGYKFSIIWEDMIGSILD